MSRRTRNRPSGILLTGAIAFLAVLTFAFYSTASQPGPTDIAAVIVTPNTSPTLPLPVQTPGPPTLTPDLTPPPTYPPLRQPPPTVPLTPNATATVFPTATFDPVITATVARGRAANALPNVAWGKETSDGLAIWVGTYSDSPTPSISDAKALVKWSADPTLKLVDLAFSPDQQFLAVLSVQPFVGEEGDYPTWLWVVDMTSGAVQHLPDYTYSDLYGYAYYRSRTKILGWLDNNRLAIQQGNELTAVIATKDGVSYVRPSFPPENVSASETVLSPDRTTFFSVAGGFLGGYWLYNVDGSNSRNIVTLENAKLIAATEWSPSGGYISFLTPVEEAGGYRFTNMGLWLLDLANNTQKVINAENVRGITTPWSPDSSKIAFLRADLPIPDPDARYNQSEKVNTNIYIANISDLKSNQLTNFSGIKSSGMQWTPGSNLILSSTAGSESEAPGIVAVSTTSGAVTILAGGSLGESLVRPVVFRSTIQPGMPHVGEPSTQPKP